MWLFGKSPPGQENSAYTSFNKALLLKGFTVFPNSNNNQEPYVEISEPSVGLFHSIIQIIVPFQCPQYVRSLQRYSCKLKRMKMYLTLGS